MKKKRICMMLVLIMLFTPMTVMATAMLDSEIAPGAVYHEYVDLTRGPSVFPDLYTGGAYISGPLSDGNVIHVTGGTSSNPLIINNYLSPVMGVSASRTNVHCGQNNSYAFIQGPFNGSTHYIQTS